MPTNIRNNLLNARRVVSLRLVPARASSKSVANIAVPARRSNTKYTDMTKYTIKKRQYRNISSIVFVDDTAKSASPAEKNATPMAAVAVVTTAMQIVIQCLSQSPFTMSPRFQHSELRIQRATPSYRGLVHHEYHMKNRLGKTKIVTGAISRNPSRCQSPTSVHR